MSAAISIGTGGPFGAEGPIITTGGALGSLFARDVVTYFTAPKALRRHNACPVTDPRGRVIGMVSRADALLAPTCAVTSTSAKH